MNVITYQKTTERMGDHDKKSRCEQCEYFGKVSDAPETLEADCTWQPCENDGYTLPCEKGAVKNESTNTLHIWELCRVQ